MICIKKELENSINKIAKQLSKRYGADFFKVAPEQYAKPSGDNEVDKLGCVSDKEYFNLTKFYFRMESNSLHQHKKFWNDLGKYLIQNL